MQLSVNIGRNSEVRPVLSWTQRVKISIGAAKGLKYIHEKAEMHRNIKSSNILLFADYDAVKITDLRLSRPAVDMTECISAVAETLGYQAPEYVYDPLNFLHSLAIVLMNHINTLLLGIL